jgi:MFS family permease
MKLGISRNTKLLSFASFLTDVSSEMIYPLFPFFLSNVLAAPAFILGLMESLGEFTLSLTSFFSGLFSDRSGRRKKFIISGYSISATLKVFLIFITSWPQMILFRILERAGKGIRDAPRDALIGLSEEKNKLGLAYGFRQMLDNFGAILGPLLATIFLAILTSNGISEAAYREIFSFAVIPAVLAVAVLAFIKDKETPKTPAKEILKDVFHVPRFKQFLIANSIFFLGQISILFFLLRANDFIPLVLIPVTYLAFNIFYTLSSMPAGMLSDRIGPRKSIIIGMVLFLLSLIGFVFFPSTIIIFVSFALLGLFMAISKTAPQTLLVRLVDERYYASAIGSYKGLAGTIALPANLIAGLLYTITIFGSPATFTLPILTTIVGIFAMIFLVKE